MSAVTTRSQRSVADIEQTTDEPPSRSPRLATSTCPTSTSTFTNTCKFTGPVKTAFRVEYVTNGTTADKLDLHLLPHRTATPVPYQRFRSDVHQYHLRCGRYSERGRRPDRQRESEGRAFGRPGDRHLRRLVVVPGVQSGSRMRESPMDQHRAFATARRPRRRRWTLRHLASRETGQAMIAFVLGITVIVATGGAILASSHHPTRPVGAGRHRGALRLSCGGSRFEHISLHGQRQPERDELQLECRWT